MKIKVGSRTSKLARLQTDYVIEQLDREHSDLEVEFVGMETLGDRERDQSVPEIGGEGVFTERLEEALIDGAIDFAVHSLKDLPTSLPANLMYAGSPRRGTPSDAFVSFRHSSIDGLPEDGTVATGSRRRRAQLRRHFPDVTFENLRGNIGTRLEKLRNRDWDGIVMATVALERLEREDVSVDPLDPNDYVPAVGQGAIGIETRGDRDEIHDLLAPIFDEETVEACKAERTFLGKLEGGCSVPIGGYCHRCKEQWRLHGWVGNLTGKTVIEHSKSGRDAEQLAEKMARQFIDQGARELLERARG